MITAVDGNYIHLQTESTSYVMRILPSGQLDHVHYGARLESLTGLYLAAESFGLTMGTQPVIDDNHPRHYPMRFMSEYSTQARGDTREAALEIDGRSVELFYKGFRILDRKPELFPAFAQWDPSVETIEILLSDEVLGVDVKLYYSLYSFQDVIVRSALIENHSDSPLRLTAAYSYTLDFLFSDFDLITLDGAWARERNIHRRRLEVGITAVDSKVGISSAEHSPAITLVRRSTGEVWQSNLIYSGCHREVAEVSPYGKTRVMSGINPSGFAWTLGPGEAFATPEAVLTYSATGLDDATWNMHRFIDAYIIRMPWAGAERPVLINSWEASYFNFTEQSLLDLAAKAEIAGAELFVLDDGWFSTRRSDRSGLGDWSVCKDIFPDGLDGFAWKIRLLGLKFGLWIEPEMVNEDSDLYRKHPDWIVNTPGRKPLICRHQYVLDITREEVRDYICDQLFPTLSSCKVDYIKWDMNRPITDAVDGYAHRYTLALYELVSRFTKAFPDTLFECCASGGGRYDLGMLCFMPQVWTSDDTDLVERIAIQEGTLMAFPPSTMGCHVSADVNHQTLRQSDIASRFAVAAFGNLGYELDLDKLERWQRSEVLNEILFYREHRHIFQYGRFRKLESFDDDIVLWSLSEDDKIVVMEMVKRNRPNTGKQDRLRIPFIDENKDYDVIEAPFRLPPEGKLPPKFMVRVSGSILKHIGLALPPRFMGTGEVEATRMMPDNSARLYLIHPAMLIPEDGVR